MKIFVTGGSGYIGSYLINALLDDGNSVHALVRKPSRAQHLKRKGVEIFQGDFTDKEAVIRAMAGCEQVYHMGGCASIWEKNPATYFDINVEGTKSVLDAALHHSVKKVVFTSTAGVLGPSISGIVTESKSRDLDFFNEYESSKALAESLVKSYALDYDLDVVIVSPTRVYGPYHQGTPGSVTLLISKFVKGQWRIVPGDGTKVGNYVFVEDVIDGHLLAMKKGTKGSTYILGGENHSYNDFFTVLREVSGNQHAIFKMPIFAQMIFARLTYAISRLRGVKPILTTKWVRRGNYHWAVSVEKAQKELGLRTTSLREGVVKTVHWAKTL